MNVFEYVFVYVFAVIFCVHEILCVCFFQFLPFWLVVDQLLYLFLSESVRA